MRSRPPESRGRRCPAVAEGLHLSEPYDTPPDKLEAIPAMITEIIDRHEHTRVDRSHFLDFGPSSLDIETVYYMEVPDFGIYAETRQSINLELYRRFQEEGIEFAFPTQTVHLQKAGGS